MNARGRTVIMTCICGQSKVQLLSGKPGLYLHKFGWAHFAPIDAVDTTRATRTADPRAGGLDREHCAHGRDAFAGYVCDRYKVLVQRDKVVVTPRRRNALIRTVMVD